jgi:hypothetical protein
MGNGRRSAEIVGVVASVCMGDRNNTAESVEGKAYVSTTRISMYVQNARRLNGMYLLQCLTMNRDLAAAGGTGTNPTARVKTRKRKQEDAAESPDEST